MEANHGWVIQKLDSCQLRLAFSGKDIISQSMQLLSGRTGQAYNTRKNRKGAFWEDRFYTTAIENGVHLLRCVAYIELNMLRASAVTHPKD